MGKFEMHSNNLCRWCMSSSGLAPPLACIAYPNAEVGDREPPAERTTQGAPGDWGDALWVVSWPIDKEHNINNLKEITLQWEWIKSGHQITAKMNGTVAIWAIKIASGSSVWKNARDHRKHYEFKLTLVWPKQPWVQKCLLVWRCRYMHRVLFWLKLLWF